MRLYFFVLATLCVCVHSRTTHQQPAVTAHITSLTDKDARSKASVHPAFANAGRQAGVEIWRIENFDPVAVSAKEYGKFYKGDSYIILKTTADKRNNLSHDIHFWIGSQSTQDESGAAAILTVGLDDKFNGAAVQHRETEGHESAQFAGYFPTAIRYMDGGVDTGFRHVTTNPGAEKRLFQVKGKRNIRVRQVDPLISSMNKGDVFILDVGNSIYVYVGDKAKNVEKLKAISVANQIRDQDHNGRARVETIDQYSSETDVQNFFTTLGSGNKNSVPEDSAGGDDQAFEKKEEQSVILSEVSDASGSLKVTPLTKPYRQEQLKPQECYILDTVSGSIYVWVGKQATEREKSEAMSKAQQYITSKQYPSWVHVARIPQGTEPAIFKQYFSTWRDVGMSHSRIVRSVDDTGVNIQSLEPQLYRIIIQNNGYQYHNIPNFKQSDLREDQVYILDAGDELYLWIGNQASNHLKKLSYTLAHNYASQPTQEFNKIVNAVKHQFETEEFTKYFEKWSPEFWNKQRIENSKEEALQWNEIDQ